MISFIREHFLQIVFCSMIVSISLHFYMKDNLNLYDTNETILLILNSRCDCKKNEEIVVKELRNKISINLNDKNKSNSKIIAVINKEEFKKMTFTCDLYNQFKRGLNQQVLSYSLYGIDEFYYDKMKNISRQINELYPNWIMRVYYDKSILNSTICELECLKDNYTNNLLDNTDFCNINNLYLNYNSFVKKNSFDAKYMHFTFWRWLPLGDSMVNIFSSRDLDSYIIKREIDSVNVWLNSNKIGHIMRGFDLFLDTF